MTVNRSLVGNSIFSGRAVRPQSPLTSSGNMIILCRVLLRGKFEHLRETKDLEHFCYWCKRENQTQRGHSAGEWPHLANLTTSQ
jgi:hypothetical protein